MSPNATKPPYSDLITEMGHYLRETRAEVNLLQAAIAAAVGVLTAESTVVVGVGQTDLVVGVDVADIQLEIVRLSAAGAETIENITGARSGQIKILILEDADVTIDHDAAKIDLNGGPAYVGAGNTLCIRNIDGDPATATDGHWDEVFRLDAV